MQELITYIVSKLVEKPEQVKVAEVAAAEKTIIEIRVAAHDLAKVIGREGRTFKALRSIVHSLDIQEKKDIVVDIVNS